MNVAILCCHVVLQCALRDSGSRRDVAKRIAVAASRFLDAMAGCVKLLFFAAEHHKPYWNGWIKVTMVICLHVFSILALVIFLSKGFFKAFKIVLVLGFGVEIIRFWT